MRIREGVSAVAGGLAIAVAIFVVGGAFRWTQAIVVGAVGVAVLANTLSRRTARRASPLLWLIGAAIALTVFQLLPMTASGLESLQPIGNGLREDGAELFGIEPSSSLTLDVPGSLRALCFLVTLLGVGWLVVRWSLSEKGRYRVLAAIGALCGLVALVIALHVITGATSLYGMYTPEQARPSVLGPLLNENHLGGLMAMGSALALGLAMYTRQHSRVRAIWVLTCAACAASTVASQSRGATLALLAGLGLTGGVMLAQRLVGSEHGPRRRGLNMTSSVPIAIVAICAIVVIVYASAGGVSEQLERTNLDEIHHPRSKFAIWKSTLDLIDESPLLGVGRGAFEPAFTRAHPAAAVHSFSHVENEYIQAAADWGLVGASILGLLTIWVIVTGARRWRDGPLAAGAIGAIGAIGLQSIVDFGVEMLGVAVPATAILATLAYAPLREVTGRALALSRARTIGLGLACVAAVPLLLSARTTTIAEDHAALGAIAAPTLDDIRPVIERHPLDYFGYALAAESMMRKGDPQAVRMLNHALRLHPTHPGLHHLAARMLVKAGREEQAAIEYSLAITSTPTLRPLVTEVVTRFSPRRAADAIPAEFPEIDVLAGLLAELKRTEVLDLWLIRVLDARPGNLKACDWLYTISLQSGDLTAAEAAGKRCSASAPSLESRARLGQLFLQNHRPEDAAKVVSDVESWTGLIATKVDGWLVACDAFEMRGALGDAKRCVRRLDATGMLAPERHGEITVRLERIDTAMRAAAPPP